MTVEQILEETRDWPTDQVGELLDRLSIKLQVSNPEIDLAWKQEAHRRLAEIESGAVQPVDGEAVLARVRKIVGR